MTGRRDGTGRTPAAAGEHRAWARELLERLRPAGRDVRGVVDRPTGRPAPRTRSRLPATGTDPSEVVPAHPAVGGLEQPALAGG
ncbi:hypothetical protein [Streptomyces sp. NPDC016626]|uniref:hypothetical protein n=1 Tax=Streptomyces sp. NPDC016626 TaxID=3364968 RepID=UPI0036F7432E